jgi:FtsH-binding integral membrane protein
VELFLLMAVGFVISAVCAWWCAVHAQAKGYSPALWGVLGFLIPVIAVIAMAVMRPTDRAV